MLGSLAPDQYAIKDDDFATNPLWNPFFTVRDLARSISWRR